MLNVKAKTIATAAALIIPLWLCAAKPLTLTSPDKDIVVTVDTNADTLAYNINFRGTPVLENGHMAMITSAGTAGINPRVAKAKTTSVKSEIKPIVPLKFSTIPDVYNQLSLKLRDGSTVEMRAYNDGFAYRFITAWPDSITVDHEVMTVDFPADYTLHVQQPWGFRTSCEEPYKHLTSQGEWAAEEKLTELPLLAQTPQGSMILLCETALEEYPGMFLLSGQNGLRSTFAKYPLTFEPEWDRSMKITSEASYIAKTKGTREFPWRYFVISPDDAGIITNTMNARLAGSSRIEDTRWIRPGQVSWEWWSGTVPYGPDVDFKAGCNTPTYKYFVDFASLYGIPYVLLDEGWAKSTLDPYTPNDALDLDELISYSRRKGVGLLLWLPWTTVDREPGLFEYYAQKGIKGIKVDFMDRQDQWMVDYYERVAREAAKHHLLVDFHGAYKPSGLEYRYPNVLSYEGVLGMEQEGRCFPQNSVWLPWIRNAVGAMDYTPGAMLSTQPECYAFARPLNGSIGTRAYQMALYVIFESGLQMLADNATNYYANDECTRFITSVPVTWDETRVLSSDTGQYIVIAKRKGAQWFIGAICNNDVPEREVTIALDFLQPNRSYQLTEFVDGINAGRQAMDYRSHKSDVTATDSITISMVRNGGYAASLR